MAKVLHLSMPSWYKLNHVLHVFYRAHDVLPVGSTPYRPCWTSSLNSQFLSCACACTFCVVFCGLKSQWHYGNGYVHVTALCSVCVITHACPTMSSSSYISVPSLLSLTVYGIWRISTRSVRASCAQCALS